MAVQVGSVHNLIHGIKIELWGVGRWLCKPVAFITSSMVSASILSFIHPVRRRTRLSVRRAARMSAKRAQLALVAPVMMQSSLRFSTKFHGNNRPQVIKDEMGCNNLSLSLCFFLFANIYLV